MSASWKSVLKRVSLSCMAAAVAFLVVDGTVRVWARVTRQVPPETVLFTYDPVLEARWHQPNSSAIVTFRGTAPHRVSFNEHGFRGTRPTALVKAPGSTRIVILGESSTEDGLVEDGKTWPELLEARLNARLGTNAVEILNLGCAGYSMAASLRNLQVNGLKFKPDMVILYHGNNDFWKAFMALPQLQRMETYIDYEARNTTWWSRLLTKSILVDRISRRLYYANMERNRICLRAYRDTPETRKRDLDMTGIEMEARRELGRIADVCATNGIWLVIGIQATLMKEQLNERELYAMWEVLRWSYDGAPITWRTFVDGPQRVKTMQRDLARDQGLLCIDVEAAVPKTVEHFLDHIHSTEAGSAAIAAAFADGLLASGILNRQPVE
jgi:lysophospholipase L1-like esterase